MSILCSIRSVLCDVLSLYMPRTCIVCGKELDDTEDAICLACGFSMPRTGFAEIKENPLRRLFRNSLLVESAMALFWFVPGTDWRRLIHKFKYRGRWLFARYMGEQMGAEMVASGNFDDIDVVIPVPLHNYRRIVRGYNQAEMLSMGIARTMGVEYDFSSVRRCRYNRSQTTKRRDERWGNTMGIFEVRNGRKLRGKHILLVDDVVTTGATIGSCAEEILRACDGDVRISVAALAVSRRVAELG